MIRSMIEKLKLALVIMQCGCAHGEDEGDISDDADMSDDEEQNGEAAKAWEEEPPLEEIVESDVELDNEGVVDGDEEPPQKVCSCS
jgi:hypothetical protein